MVMMHMYKRDVKIKGDVDNKVMWQALHLQILVLML